MKIDSINGHRLVIYSGPGLDNCEIEEGRLEVRYAKGTKQFDSIAAAVIFYYKLNEEASIWKVAEKPALLESKIVISV